MKLERTTTGVTIHEPSDAVKRVILQYFSLVNPIREFFIYSSNNKDAKHHILKVDEYDMIYITSGFLCLKNQVVQSLPSPHVITPKNPVHIDVTMNRSPRSPLQQDAINKMTTSGASKVTVELKPGVECNTNRRPRRVICVKNNPFELLGRRA